MKTLTCTLPGGYTDASGLLHTSAELRGLSGREEELLTARGRVNAALLVTEILAACIIRIGSISPVHQSVVRSLLAADRQFLLLKLREATLGPDVRGTLPCPWPGCGSKVDIDFRITDIPVRDSKDKGPVYRIDLAETDNTGPEKEGKPSSICFRLPDGSDQEAVYGMVEDNPAAALSALLERCILTEPGQKRGPGMKAVSALSPRQRQMIEEEMLRVGPYVDLDMHMTCAECGRAFTASFDIQDFFFGELRADIDMLYREVHYLAYHYHWSEEEILSMTQDRRRKYIEVLAEEIERMNNAV